jgi:fatty acid desaturase
MTDYTTMSEAELFKAEREIASKHIDKFPWGSLLWASTNITVWFSLWPLVIFDLVPLWLGFLIAIVCIALSYLPSHEAQHDIYAKPGTSLRWLNEAVGHISLIPLVLPYRIARATHMEHHKHANDPALDPDYGVHAPNARAAIINSFLRTQRGNDEYGECLVRIGQERLGIDALIANVYFYGALAGFAWSGYAIEAALLWWLPRHIGTTWIQFYLSWAPHHPGNEKGRYRDTRAFKSRLGNLVSGGMQYHIIHHLHPRIPLLRTGRAYWEMRPILEARGCDVDELKQLPS